MTQPWQVVVVEDEEADRIFITKAFERGAHDYDVTACSSGVEALAHLEQCSADGTPPDLVLLDLSLPTMSGLDVLTEIRQRETFPALIVIVFTSSSYRREVDAAYTAGANAFVTKPARLADLDRLVQSIEDFWFTAGQRPYA